MSAATGISLTNCGNPDGAAMCLGRCSLHPVAVIAAPQPLPRDRLAMAGVRHGIAWERRVVLFLIESALHHAAGRPDAVEALEQLRINVEAYG